MQYDFARDAKERRATALLCEDPSLAIQNAPDSDLNELMRRFGVDDGSALPANMGVIDPRYYGDFSDIPDLRTALDNTRAAEERFAQLPAKLRARFGNDPYALHQWVHDPSNHEEAVTIGLLRKNPPKDKPIATPSQQTVTETPAPAEKSSKPDKTP